MNRLVFASTAMLFALTGCGQAPDPSPTVAGRSDQQQRAENARRPGMTSEMVAADLVGKKLAIYEANGDGAAIEWAFNAGDFRQVNIQENNSTSSGATLVMFITTSKEQKPGDPQPHAAGKLEIQYEWKSGQRILTNIRNLTFRYTASLPG